jgi:tRNA(fMet)-specific endonuclease VapC
VKYLLDTNVCVDYLTRRHAGVVDRVQRSDPDELCLSSIVIAELRYGADKSQRRSENHRSIDVLVQEMMCIDFDAKAALEFGRIRSALERRGEPIGPYDFLIAAHALSLGLVLVTDNVREFHKVEGIRVENWRETV